MNLHRLILLSRHTGGLHAISARRFRVVLELDFSSISAQGVNMLAHVGRAESDFR
jgi:hypothetical protein